ncbi:YafY family protein [Sulfurimonas sp.]|jgi:predicted DNA-binding transcriptional regulator YafY|uniref:helix-turn-helix transcriptional regulator n=1 Tax=Sulfurimonas sp. TaxID=2022749 RepID=UPI0025FE073B|nr:WYL domain-containing protein [Sulfurimonas sp.]MBT5935182.1 WYL domain-containing protein [Sulfurimonas sp.]
MAYKQDYDKTLTRLNTIIARLNEGEALSVKELAQEFNVSDRTVQRDFNERLVTLYPIYQDKRRWKMQQGFKIEKAKSIEDTIILDILDKMTDGLGSKFSIKAKKMLSKIKNSDFNPIYAKLNLEDISSNINDIATLENAIKNNQQIECRYDFGTYDLKIKLKPLRVANFEGFWYLIALDARNDTLKKYHLKSLSDTVILNIKFILDDTIETTLDNAINIWFNTTTDAFEVILFLDKHAAKILKRKPISKSQRVISEYKDGSCDISLMITHQREITSIVQYWMPHIKVISPTSVKNFVVKNCQKFLEEI